MGKGRRHTGTERDTKIEAEVQRDSDRDIRQTHNTQGEKSFEARRASLGNSREISKNGTEMGSNPYQHIEPSFTT